MAAQENTWLIRLFKDLCHFDNQWTAPLGENPVFHERIKHVEMYYHFIKGKVLQDEIELKQIDTKD